jgi:CheY-like chemotaxis protein
MIPRQAYQRGTESVSAVIPDPHLYEEADQAIESRHIHTDSNFRVLLVEDCPNTRVFLSHLLENIGMDVTTTEDGMGCLEAVRTSLHEVNPFDLILMDISLPDIDGCNTTRLLRTKGYEGPIVAISAAPSLHKRLDSIHAGCDEFLAKRNIVDTIVPTLEKLASSPISGDS